jgi:hypothetical protein
LAAIASSSNTALISEISKNTDQRDQSKTQGLISALIALAECIGPIIFNAIPKIIPMENHPTYMFLLGTATQALIMLLHKTTTTQPNNTPRPFIEEPLLQTIDETNINDIDN